MRSLTREEFLRFGKFLRSPFFNYTTSLVHFYKALKRHHPNFNSPRLKIEKLWARAFPEKKFDAQKFRQLCSDLTRLVEKYLVQLEMERSVVKSNQMLLQSLGRRNAYSLFEKEAKKQIGNLEKIPDQDAACFLDLANPRPRCAT